MQFLATDGCVHIVHLLDEDRILHEAVISNSCDLVVGAHIKDNYRISFLFNTESPEIELISQFRWGELSIQLDGILISQSEDVGVAIDEHDATDAEHHRQSHQKKTDIAV